MKQEINQVKKRSIHSRLFANYWPHIEFEAGRCDAAFNGLTEAEHNTLALVYVDGQSGMAAQRQTGKRINVVENKLRSLVYAQLTPDQEAKSLELGYA